MSILIKYVRVYGFRGLENIEVELGPTTVMTGMNNTGKTSFLKALQLVIGARPMVSPDDFFIKGENSSDKIIIDLKIVPLDNEENIIKEFEDIWVELFDIDKIKFDEQEFQFIPVRTEAYYNKGTGNYKIRQLILPEWPEYQVKSNDVEGNEKIIYWYEKECENEKSFRYEELPFFYMDALRDIIEDMRLKTSYLGKMISKIEYSKTDLEAIERQIKELNETTVSKSEILSDIRDTLKELNTAMDTEGEGIEITPFTKKIRDLNKGLSIHYADRNDSFSMEYHGTGTRSWSSLLTLKSFISQLKKVAEREYLPLNPILALEEPEAHLHPNAQKKLYGQLKEIPGQKIISTHSPYIAACAELEELRGFYKSDTVVCNKIDVNNLHSEDIRKIKRQVINTRGELFFSRIIVLIEGETEEQALPIFCERFFGRTSIEMEINFIGVGGHGNYKIFLRIAEAFNIPWFILSDAEKKLADLVKEQVIEVCGKAALQKIIFLDEGKDFEAQLIQDGYKEEIKEAIKSMELPKCCNEKHKAAKISEIEGYSDEKIHSIISSSKTQYAPAIADAIIQNSTKELPPKVVQLFKLFNSILSPNKKEE